MTKVSKDVVGPTVLTEDGGVPLKGGFTIDSGDHDYGTIAAAGTLTVDLAKKALAKATIAGSFTLAPDAANIGAQEILTTNSGAGGYTITTTAWDKVRGAFNGATGAKNLLRVTQHDALDVLEIVDVT